MEKIKIYNRDGQNIWFEQVSENLFVIKSNSTYALKYACVNYDKVETEDESDFSWTDNDGIKHYGKMCSFDPAGGPYIGVGSYTINNKVVTRIYSKDQNIYFVTE